MFTLPVLLGLDDCAKGTNLHFCHSGTVTALRVGIESVGWFTHTQSGQLAGSVLSHGAEYNQSRIISCHYLLYRGETGATLHRVQGLCY